MFSAQIHVSSFVGFTVQNLKEVVHSGSWSRCALVKKMVWE